MEQGLDAIERRQLPDKLIIDEISAPGNDENLKNVVTTLSKIINCPVPSLKNLYRIKSKNTKNNESGDGTIVPKFLNAGDRIFFIYFIYLKY